MRIDRVAAFDTETSGTDTHNDRIIQAFVGLMGSDGEWIEKREWLIDWGIDIPEGASDVHGYTRERLAREGRQDTEACIHEIADTIQSFTGPSTPLVAHNMSFDASILDAEMQRLGYVWSLLDCDRDQGLSIPAVDTLVLDKYRDKFRKGKRTLTAAAEHYGVPVEEDAHDAGADCLMSGRIALKLLKGYRGTLKDLHELQVKEAREQRQSLQEYFQRSGKTEPDGSVILIDGGWPIYDSHKRERA